MEADMLQRSGRFPKAALLPVNKQKYWSAKYNISLWRMSALEMRWTQASRGGDVVSLWDAHWPAGKPTWRRRRHGSHQSQICPRVWLTPVPSSLYQVSAFFVLFFFFLGADTNRALKMKRCWWVLIIKRAANVKAEWKWNMGGAPQERWESRRARTDFKRWQWEVGPSDLLSVRFTSSA